MTKVDQTSDIKVIHLITGLATGGAEIALFRLLSNMDENRFSNIAVSLTDEGTLGGPLRDRGIPVIALGMKRGSIELSGLWRLMRLLRRERPALVQTWLYHSDLLGLIAGRLTRVPLVAWNIRCSETDERYKRGLNGALIRLLAMLSGWPDVVVANSSAGIESHRRLGYHPRRWEMLPNGIDLGRFRPDKKARNQVRDELGLKHDKLLVGLVARFDPLKDHETFLRAAASVARESPENHHLIHFVMVGEGVDPKNETLNSLVNALGLANQIHMLGERRDLERLNAAFDVATCSSTGEGFPNTIAEAMACGVPCVTTNVGDAAIIVGDTGFAVPARDPDAMASAFSKLINAGAGGRERLGEAARQRITERYSIAAMVARYEYLYSEMSSERLRKYSPHQPQRR